MAEETYDQRMGRHADYYKDEVKRLRAKLVKVAGLICTQFGGSLKELEYCIEEEEIQVPGALEVLWKQMGGIAAECLGSVWCGEG